MPDYSKGCIYMIKKQDDYDNKNVYIGSCCNFSRRKCKHKLTCNNPTYNQHNLKVYQYIRENDGWDYWIMTKIIDYPCNNKGELNTMERKYIDEYKSILNCNIPTRTSKEYHNDNREKTAQQQKKYRNSIKEHVSKRMKQYYIDNIEKITQKVKCDKCGCEVRKDGLAKHKKTLKCINFVKK